jgi:hypothetical protein
MAGRRTIFRSSRSIAGAALLMVGMFILYENLAGAVTALSHALANRSEALGVVPAVVLAVSQPVQAYAADHQRFFRDVFHQLLGSSWPLLLVIFGSVLSRDTFAEKSKHIQKNNTQAVDRPPACPTYRFARSRVRTIPASKN